MRACISKKYESTYRWDSMPDQNWIDVDEETGEIVAVSVGSQYAGCACNREGYLKCVHRDSCVQSVFRCCDTKTLDALKCFGITVKEQIMTELEHAIHNLEMRLDKNSPIRMSAYYRDNEEAEDASIAADRMSLDALREKAVREKGCAYCNGKYGIVSQLVNKRDDEPISIPCRAGYCPRCGRDLNGGMK